MSISQFHILKPGMKNGTPVTLNFSSNAVGDSTDETNCPHKLLLTNTQVSNILKGFFKWFISWSKILKNSVI